MRLFNLRISFVFKCAVCSRKMYPSEPVLMCNLLVPTVIWSYKILIQATSACDVNVALVLMCSGLESTDENYIYTLINLYIICPKPFFLSLIWCLEKNHFSFWSRLQGWDENFCPVNAHQVQHAPKWKSNWCCRCQFNITLGYFFKTAWTSLLVFLVSL